ncbi:phosphotransferase enzyme family protein [Histoplasma capsulatum G186AR]|uniref:Phosphotransferase enzyme family protein n=1 Tax=Ajellomyces capsulatus TaxID=5037 RepID=A0A8H8CYX2_AJECA|nr:phosphotransferase enzyme family protein [Histoplasma capsulatum]QSS75245.1 phosphotransferase enzyme family protein [Histoplasma capsulatum G186AR]
MIKLAEGGSNKVFRLTMDDGTTAIARIPHPNMGPPFKTTASEVATMDFVRTVLNIPVPKVLAWSGNADNAVKSEYIIMEAAAGTQLADIWEDMEIDNKLKVVENIVLIEKKLLSLSFNRYGSLYFADDAFPGCEKVEIIGDIPRSQKREIESRFVLGPVASNDFWDRERSHMDIDRGPWETAQDYLRAIPRREIAWISYHATTEPSQNLFKTSEAQISPNAHIALYRKFSTVTDHLLPRDLELNRPTIWHCDLHSPNLFVDGDRVTSVIDWQGVWTGPLFLQARHPALVNYSGEIVLKIPDHYKDIEDESEKARIRAQVEKSILLWAYESDTKENNFLVHDVLRFPHGRTVRDVVGFSANTWDGDILPFRESLIRIVRHWKDICPEMACPITFSDEELKSHYRDAEGWNEIADFWDSLDGFVHRDGWTSNQNYEKAYKMFVELREQTFEDLT